MLQPPTLVNEDKEKKEKKKDKNNNSNTSLNESTNMPNELVIDSVDYYYNGELDLLHGNAIYELTAKSLDDLLQTIINRDLTSDNLNFVFKYLEPWLTSVNDCERLRSMRTLTKILKFFAETYKHKVFRFIIIIIIIII